MKPDLAAETEKVIRLRAESARTGCPDDRLGQIEDALSEGYAKALEGDAWSLRMEQRMHDLIDDALADGRVNLRVLANEHVRFQRALISLRSELAGLRQDRDRLCARSSG